MTHRRRLTARLGAWGGAAVVERKSGIEELTSGSPGDGIAAAPFVRCGKKQPELKGFNSFTPFHHPLSTAPTTTRAAWLFLQRNATVQQ